MRALHLEHQPWIRNPLAALVLPLAVVASLLLGTRTWEGGPADHAFAVVGVLVPLAVLLTTILTGLEVRVDRAGLLVRPRPFEGRRVAWRDVVDARVIEYHPILDHGGWGVRATGHDGLSRAYTVSGVRALRLDLVDGTHLIVGSRDPDALLDAVVHARYGGGPVRHDVRSYTGPRPHHG